MDQPIRVALLDFDSDVRFGRRMLIASNANFEVVLDSDGKTSDLEAVAEGLVDVVVINQRLASGSAASFYSQLRDQAGLLESPSCVFTAAFEQPSLLHAALEVGAYGVVSLEQGPEALITAIEDSFAGKSSQDLETLYDLISRENNKPKLDLKLVGLVEELPGKLASDLRSLRAIWLKGSRSRLKDFPLRDLAGLVSKLQVRTPAELVIRLHQSGLLDEK